MVIEKSWRSHGALDIGKKIMELCDHLWNFINFAPELYQMCMFFASTKNLSINVDSLHFLTFSAICPRMQNREERQSWKTEKWSWKSHGKICCLVCRNPELTKTI